MPGMSPIERAALLKRRIEQMRPHALACDDGSMAAWAVMEGVNDLTRDIDALIVALTPPVEQPAPEESAPVQEDWVEQVAQGKL